MENVDQILPFVRCSHGSPHICGRTRWASPNTSQKGRERSRATPSCPCCSHWGSMVPSLQFKGVRDNEHVLPYHDDVYTVCKPARVADGHGVVDEELLSHAHIQLHHGKTQVWNRGVLEPAGIGALTRAARAVKPDAVVWRGDLLLPVQKQGLKILEISSGSLLSSPQSRPR